MAIRPLTDSVFQQLVAFIHRFSASTELNSLKVIAHFSVLTAISNRTLQKALRNPRRDRHFDLFDRKSDERSRWMKTLVPDSCCSGGTLKLRFCESVMPILARSSSTFTRQLFPRFFLGHRFDIAQHLRQLGIACGLRSILLDTGGHLGDCR